MTALHVRTGALGYVEASRPRPGPAARGKGAVAVRPGPVAYYPGETEDDARAFAGHLFAVWAGRSERAAKRRELGWPSIDYSASHLIARAKFYRDEELDPIGPMLREVDWAGASCQLPVIAAAVPTAVVKPSIARQKAPRKAAAPVMAPTVEAHDGGTCARCGRSDFRTPKGRDWHIGNNPDCAKYRKPDRHAYATL